MQVLLQGVPHSNPHMNLQSHLRATLREKAKSIRNRHYRVGSYQNEQEHEINKNNHAESFIHMFAKVTHDIKQKIKDQKRRSRLNFSECKNQNIHSSKNQIKRNLSFDESIQNLKVSQKTTKSNSLLRIDNKKNVVCTRKMSNPNLQQKLIKGRTLSKFYEHHAERSVKSRFTNDNQTQSRYKQVYLYHGNNYQVRQNPENIGQKLLVMNQCEDDDEPLKQIYDKIFVTEKPHTTNGRRKITRTMKSFYSSLKINGERKPQMQVQQQKKQRSSQRRLPIYSSNPLQQKICLIQQEPLTPWAKINN